MADQAKYIRIFKEEAEEHLASLSLGLLELEQRAEDKGLIHELLRNAHTLKGSAKMLGLNHIGDVGHKMEDIFKAVENGELKINATLIDVLLMGTDAIRDIVDTLSSGEVTDIDVSVPLAKLVAAMSGGEPEPKKEPPKPEAKSKKEPPKAEAPKKTAHPEPKKEDEPKREQATPAMPQQPQASQKLDARPAVAAKETIRVDTRKLDDLLNLAGELLINKIKIEGRIHRLRTTLDAMADIRAPRLNGNPEKSMNELLVVAQEYQRKIFEIYQELSDDLIELDIFSQDIRNHSFALRVLPANTLFEEFTRTVRDLARDLGKEIRLDVTGGETELDKQLLEELKPALVHIIRNSCDHGIEKPDVREANGKPREGRIHINAFHKGNTVVIDIKDDGGGIDVDVIRQTAIKKGLVNEKAAKEISDEDALYFILMPGFSTAKIITDYSGRGVGMDVVKTNMERIKGDMTIGTELGKFTKITLTAPLTLSIMNSLLIMANDSVYAIPLTFVEETVRLPVKGIFSEAGRDVFNLRGNIVPLVKLTELLGLKEKITAPPDKIPVVLLKFRNQRLGLIVQSFLRDQEIVVKTMGDFLKNVPMSSGATILRQGEPAIILNVFDVFEASEKLPTSGIKDLFNKALAEKREIKILVVDDSITTRIMEKTILEAQGYKVELAVSGEEAQEKLARTEYDLVVSDVEMPGITGFELTRRIRQDDKTKDIPVIICTSLSSDEDKRKGIEVGAQGYIVKGSFDQTVLLNTVKSLVG